MLPMKEISLAPGVTLRTVQTQKFKTSILGVTFLEPLSEKTAALNALLPWVLQRGTQAHPDMDHSLLRRTIYTAEPFLLFCEKKERSSALVSWLASWTMPLFRRGLIF